MTEFPSQIEADVPRRLNALGVRVEDVVEKFIRGTGAGGQKINKTSSTVWLRHGPTGVEVRCQRERSQAANRALAWAELCGKLEERRRLAKAQARAAEEQERRRRRGRPRGVKAGFVESKRRRAQTKAWRGKVEG